LKYEVFPISRSSIFESDSCYPDLHSIPSVLDGVIIVTNSASAEKIVKQCVELNIPRVWMHCSSGISSSRRVESSTNHRHNKTSSVSHKAVLLCREHNIAVIPGACPMMFCQSADWWHRFMRWALSKTKKLSVE